MEDGRGQSGGRDPLRLQQAQGSHADLSHDLPDYSNCEKYTHAWETLLGCENPPKERLDMAAVEKHADADSAPIFLAHTFNDPIVDVRNAMALGNAYAEAGVPFEMHIYPDGPHGLSVANETSARGRPGYINPAFAEWVRLAAAWAETL